MPTLIERTCPTCNRRFSVEYKRRNRPGYCSLKCRPPSRSSVHVECTCGHCGKSFYKRPSEVAEGRGKHCSRSCAALARPINGRPSAISTEAIALFLAECPVLAVPEMRLGRWSVDLALPLINVAVELDGTYWHSLPAMTERDRRKDDWLLAHGWTVVRIPIEARATAEGVAARMKEALGL